MNIYDIIRRPIVTEKAESLRDLNIYAFEVDRRANKKLVKEAVRKIYGVIPRRVNILNVRGKKKKSRFGEGYTSNRKKAYIFLSKKDKIELFEGV